MILTPSELKFQPTPENSSPPAMAGPAASNELPVESLGALAGSDRPRWVLPVAVAGGVALAGGAALYFAKKKGK